MSLFVIADLHLSTLESTNKSMEVFGAKWADYVNRLETSWRKLVGQDDTVVVAGDISWALTLEEAKSDLCFLDNLPGKKILLKGNHDFWWSTASKLNAYIAQHDFKTLHFLHNNAYIADQYLIMGTRGWYHDSDADGAKQANAQYDKIVARECVRLALSVEAGQQLQAKQDKPLIPLCFLHFPPYWCEKSCLPMLEAMKQLNIKTCYFGHIHGACPTQFEKEGIQFTLVAADALGFVPKLIALDAFGVDD